MVIGLITMCTQFMHAWCCAWVTHPCLVCSVVYSEKCRMWCIVSCLVCRVKCAVQYSVPCALCSGHEQQVGEWGGQCSDKCSQCDLLWQAELASQLNMLQERASEGYLSYLSEGYLACHLAQCVAGQQWSAIRREHMAAVHGSSHG